MRVETRLVVPDNAEVVVSCRVTVGEAREMVKRLKTIDAASYYSPLEDLRRAFELSIYAADEKYCGESEERKKATK